MTFRLLAVVTGLAALGAAPLFAEDLEFDLINQSSVDLHELYVSARGTDSWGEDILGIDVLASGEHSRVTVSDGKDTCGFDLRFVTKEGASIERPNVDLCATQAYGFSE